MRPSVNRSEPACRLDNQAPWVALAAQPGTTVIGPDGPAPFGDVFEGRDELVVYSHMFYDGEPWEWQCEGPGVTGVGVQTG